MGEMWYWLFLLANNWHWMLQLWKFLYENIKYFIDFSRKSNFKWQVCLNNLINKFYVYYIYFFIFNRWYWMFKKNNFWKAPESFDKNIFKFFHFDYSYILFLILEIITISMWGTIPSVGNVAQPPLGKASGERGWWTGPTPTDRFSHGKSGLHCT